MRTGPAELRIKEEEDTARQVMVKYCLFCRETILADAVACKHCGHVVHVFEGNVFKQLYCLLWGGIIVFVGSLLPFFQGEGLPLVPAYQTLLGSLYLVFSLLLVAAMAFSIYSKRMIFSPVFLMFIPAISTWWTTITAIGGLTFLDDEGEMRGFAFGDVFKGDTYKALVEQIGSGSFLILIGSTIVVVTFIVSLFTALTGGGKAEEKGKARGKSKSRERKKKEEKKKSRDKKKDKKKEKKEKKKDKKKDKKKEKDNGKAENRGKRRSK